MTGMDKSFLIKNNNNTFRFHGDLRSSKSFLESKEIKTAINISIVLLIINSNNIIVYSSHVVLS